ncbi:MAG: hypothetical protein QXO67_00210 [Candidatus Bathyarchaeia archaeon]
MSIEYPERIQEFRPLKMFTPPPAEPKLATYIDITSFTLPDKASPNELVTFVVTAKVKSSLPSSDPIAAMGIIYLSGPSSTVKLTVNGKEFELSKNEGVMLVNGQNPPVGYEITAGCWMKLTDAGKYDFMVATYVCHVSDNTLYYTRDGSLSKTIEIIAPAAPAAPSGFDQMTKVLTEQFLPMMMSMMMLMMMMSMLSSMMTSIREAVKKE